MPSNFNSREYLDKDLNKFLENEKFNTYFNYLIQENEKYNLTGITDIDEVYYKHFYDSIYISKVINLENKSILDVGSGAGFPSLPLRIINESIKVTIIDSLTKRITFLNELCKILDLNDVSVINGRAEEIEKKHFFDIVTARAVARLNILAELTIPHVKKGGYMIAMKSVNFETELKEAEKAILKLGGIVEAVKKYQISKNEYHVLILIKKIKDTPDEYPRSFSRIKRSPL